MPDILAFILWVEAQMPSSSASLAITCPIDGSGGGGIDGGVPPLCS
jgi:hypothetical protein